MESRHCCRERCLQHSVDAADSARDDVVHGDGRGRCCCARRGGIEALLRALDGHLLR